MQENTDRPTVAYGVHSTHESTLRDQQKVVEKCWICAVEREHKVLPKLEMYNLHEHADDDGHHPILIQTYSYFCFIV